MMLPRDLSSSFLGSSSSTDFIIIPLFVCLSFVCHLFGFFFFFFNFFSLCGMLNFSFILPPLLLFFYLFHLYPPIILHRWWKAPHSRENKQHQHHYQQQQEEEIEYVSRTRNAKQIERKKERERFKRDAENREQNQR